MQKEWSVSLKRTFDFVRIDGENFHFFQLLTLHFIQVKLGNKAYKDQVSTEGCTYFADFRGAVKKKFSPYLDSYSTVQLTLLQPDGNTEIDPGEAIAKLNEFRLWMNCPYQLLVAVLKNSSLTKE